MYRIGLNRQTDGMRQTDRQTDGMRQADRQMEWDVDKEGKNW